MPVRSFMGLFGKQSPTYAPNPPTSAQLQNQLSNGLYGGYAGGAGGGGSVSGVGWVGAGNAIAGIPGVGGGSVVFPAGISQATLGVSVGSVYQEMPLPTEFDITLGGKKLMTIKADGTIIKGEGFTTEDEFSIKFWESIMDAFPIAWWKGLVKRR